MEGWERQLRQAALNRELRLELTRHDAALIIAELDRLRVQCEQFKAAAWAALDRTPMRAAR